MGLKRLGDAFLQNDSDKVMVAKSRGLGLGSVITGRSTTISERILRMAAVELVCRSCGVETSLGEARDDGRCAEKSCKGKLKVKDAGDDDTDDEMDGSEKENRGIARSKKGEIPRGLSSGDDPVPSPHLSKRAPGPHDVPCGFLDGERLYSDTRKIRTPFTGERGRVLRPIKE